MTWESLRQSSMSLKSLKKLNKTELENMKKNEFEDVEIGEQKQTIDKGFFNVKSFEMAEVKNLESGDGLKLVLTGEITDKAKAVIGEFNISSVKFISPKTKKVTQSGLWLNSDKEGKLPYNSAVAITLRHYALKSIKQFVGKELEMETDEKGYYCIKAY